MEGEGKRQWGKVQNGSNTFAPLLFCFFFSCWQSIPPDFFSICDSFISSHMHILYIFIISYLSVWLQCLFHSACEICVVILAHSGRICRPWWINLIIWPSWHVLFTFDIIFMLLLPITMTCCSSCGNSDTILTNMYPSLLVTDWFMLACFVAKAAKIKKKAIQLFFEHSFISHIT